MVSSLIHSLNQLPQATLTAVHEVAALSRDAGGRALLVGGCVRDGLRGQAPKDIDIEVFGVEPNQLHACLSQRFKVSLIGKSFGVLLLKGYPIDVSIPRRESKSTSGHKGFYIESDPGLSFIAAAARRDFRINAISWDPLTGELIDPFEGLADMQAGRLRHVSDQFSEDPLRVLRAMQFSARFAYHVAPETIALCQTIEPEGLPPERQFEEWAKLIRSGVTPSLGLRFLKASGWVQYYPELAAMIDCPQDPRWHPEGDVWTHTLHCMDAYAKQRTGDDWEDLVVGFGVLCHDIGKPLTTQTDAEGTIRSPGHDVEGLKPTERFLRRLTQHKELIDSVLPLVETHMRPADLYKHQASDAAVRRLARKVRIDRLVRVADADMAGRPPLPADFPAGAWLQERADALQVKDQAPKPLVQGRHLIELGHEPGKNFRDILDACFEAQLEGAFDDINGGLAYLKRHLGH